jgi:hypothetical protein
MLLASRLGIGAVAGPELRRTITAVVAGWWCGIVTNATYC